MSLPCGLLLFISRTLVAWEMKAPPPPLLPPPHTPTALFEKAAEKLQTRVSCVLFWRILQTAVVPVALDKIAQLMCFCFGSLLLKSFIPSPWMISALRSAPMSSVLRVFFAWKRQLLLYNQKLEIVQKKKKSVCNLADKKVTNPYCAASPGTFCVGTQWSIIRMLTARVFSPLTFPSTLQCFV